MLNAISLVPPVETSAAVALMPPFIIVSARSIIADIAPELSITGRKNIALKNALPGNFLFRSIAMNKLKNVISGTSMSMFATEVVSICLNDPCSRNA